MAQFGNCPGGPNDSDLRLELLGKIKKVFILADNDALLKFGVAANVAVEGVPQAGLQHVLAIESAFAQVLGEGRGKLIVDEEFHDAGSTTWSV